jgi:Mn2+/Fe2+ NRAMP family transporter
MVNTRVLRVFSTAIYSSFIIIYQGLDRLLSFGFVLFSFVIPLFSFVILYILMCCKENSSLKEKVSTRYDFVTGLR